MMTLKEYVENAEQKRKIGLEVSDESVAISFILDQTNGEESLLAIAKALADKMEKTRWQMQKAYTQMSMPCSFYYKDYPYEIASILDSLTVTMKFNMRFSKDQLNDMKSITIKEKTPFWHDLAEAIKATQDENYKPTFFAYNVVDWKVPLEELIMREEI